MTDETEYRNLFDSVGARLAGLAEGLSKGLRPDDVCGLFLAIAVAGMSEFMPRADVAARLREVAENIDTDKQVMN